MLFKITVNCLFNDIWRYLIIGCFDWKTGVFQQTFVTSLLYQWFSHWCSSIELTKESSFVLWNKPFHKRLAQTFLGSSVYWLINLEGDSFPLMLKFKTLGLLHVIACKNIYRYCKNKT